MKEKERDRERRSDHRARGDMTGGMSMMSVMVLMVVVEGVVVKGRVGCIIGDKVGGG